MIRTIWLGFSFLIIVAGAGSFRFAYGHFDVANASNIVLPEQDRTIVPEVVQDTLTKSDQLPVAYVTPAPAPPDAAELAKAAYIAVESQHRMPPATIAAEVVEPQAEAPFLRALAAVRPAAAVVKKAKIGKPKRILPKLDAAASKLPPAADPKACQVEEFEAFRYALNLPTGCHS